MKPEIFFKNLSEISPSLDDFKLEYSLIADHLYGNFNVKKIGDSKYDTLEEDLICNYDLRRFLDGLLNFNDKIIDLPECKLIGFMEADPLVIDRETKKIAIVYHDRDEYTIIFYAAENMDKFLDALFMALKFYSKFWLNRKKDYSSRESSLNNCLIAAGGAEFMDFWNAFLPVEYDNKNLV